MPATFSGSRRVGPYWCSRVSIAEAGGASRELSVISRIEPTALPGDAIIVMGLVMDGGVLWASELLSAAAASAPATAAESDPFNQPGL
jgi:ribosomal protein L18E